MSKTNGWVRLKKTDSNYFDLPCIKDNKGVVIKVFDLQGKELVHNPSSRSVRFQDIYYYY